MFTRGGAMDKATEQYVTALKKGATLLKYGRRGKPKFCPFRLSQDEMELIYHLGKDEKYLKLSTVTSLSTGQKTAVFQRHPRPHQDHLSFSLIHSGGERSLDLICKDEDEFEIWYKGLKALFLAHQRRLHSAGQQSSPVRSLKDAAGYFHSESNLTNRTTISTRSTPPASPQSALLEYHPPAKPDARPLSRSASAGEAIATVRSLDGKRPTYDPSDSGASVVEGLPMRSVSSELPRVLLSSAASTSSNNDDENLGDVYMWGEGLGDGVLGGGSLRVGSGGPGAHVDALMPKLMESTVVLDVQMIACGGRHAALVNRQGETFCWGEEAGGRLGHGVDSDVQQPEIVDGFAGVQMEKVACGEYHTCAVSTSGELFTWGDGSYGCGLLGHGNDLSHWMPKRIEALDGIKIAEIACGPWHTAAVSTSGRLYTWGDGTFGALGHGTRATVTTPREVETLKELRVSKVACGVWHTAAVVEHTTADGLSSLNRLYTWGDGDKCRLGHGNKETKWVPTVVEALLGESVVQVACGHSMTVALTSAGSVFTCGSGVYGQLGNPSASGKVPGVVEGKLKGQFVDQIACGAFHVVALTSTQHIYAWGKGANGRLGMGDTKDREFPTLVEALKDKQVVAISCGSSFTAAICTHKWASGEDHSKCNNCKNAFTLTRRRHNCYNCGLVFCHSCSSKKALKAALSPNPAKPSRVCDPCFNKLSKAADIGDSFTLPAWKMGVPKNNVRSVGKAPVAPPKPAPANDPLPYRTNVSGPGRKEGARTGRVTPSPFPNASDGRPPPAIAQNPAVANLRERPPASRTPPRGQSPTRRGAAPNSGSSSPRGGYEELKRINDSLHQEVVRLNAQVEKLAVRCEELEEESRFVRADAEKKVAQANAAAHEEANKGRASEEVIRSLLAQIQDMAERLPEDSYRYGRIGAVPIKANETSPVTRSPEGSMSDDTPPPVPADPRLRAFSLSPATGLANRPMELSAFQSAKWDVETSPRGSPLNLSMTSSQGGGQSIETDSLDENITVVSTEGASAAVTEKPPRPGRSRFSASSESRDGERVEQVSQGVYLTLRSNSQGEMELKRVRFSRKLFSESEAERWWAENRTRVLGNFGIHVT